MKLLGAFFSTALLLKPNPEYASKTDEKAVVYKLCSPQYIYAKEINTHQQPPIIIN